MARRLYREKPRAPAAPRTVPEEVQLLLSFTNTWDAGGGSRELATPSDLSDYLSRKGLLPQGTGLSEDDLERVREVRAGLRALIAANTGAPLDDDALRRLDRVASASVVRVRFGTDGSPSFEPASAGVDGALGHLLATVASVFSAGHWPRLKLCAAETCRRAFYDRTRNHGGLWCSSPCGNRYAARDYRRRRKVKLGI